MMSRKCKRNNKLLDIRDFWKDIIELPMENGLVLKSLVLKLQNMRAMKVEH